MAGFGEHRGLQASYISYICLINSKDIHAKAFMRWLPLTKRGFLR
jgi:hypothetical protein